MEKKQEGMSLDDLPTWDLAWWVYYSVETSLNALEDLLKLYNSQWALKRIEIERQVEKYRSEHKIGNTPYDFEQSHIYEIKSRADFSVFLGAYSILESFLWKMCDHIDREFNFQLKLADLNSRNYLNHYKNYLVKVYGVERSVFEKHYPDLYKYSCLRNVLIHSDGNSPNKQKLNGIKGIRIYSGSNNFRVVIDNEIFFESFFKIGKLFLEDIHKSIDKRYVQLTSQQTS